MKKLILALCVVCSFSVNANVWEVNSNNLPIVGNESKDALAIYDSGVIGIISIERCQMESETSVIREVNGTAVNFKTLCVASNERLYPKSKKGNEFILNEFKTKGKVVIGDMIFSAKGFMSAVKKAEKTEKEAL